MWRVIRALEDDRIDLFSEKGIGDAALLPILGVFDDHKNDVMPDYMAAKTKQLFGGSGRLQDTGLGSQLAAAILTDPLTYLTGGASAIAKIGKAGTKLSRSAPTLSKILREGAEASGKNLDEFVGQLAPDAYQTYIRQAIDVSRAQTGGKAAKELKHLTKLDNQISQALPEALQLASKKGIENLTMAEALKHTRDRQLAIGLPGMVTLGVQKDVLPGYQSWYQVFKAGINKGGSNIAKAALTKELTALPWVKPIVDRAALIASGPLKGYRVGGLARAAVSEGGNLQPEQVTQFRSWLNLDSGAAGVVRQLHKAATKYNGAANLNKKIVDRYEELIKVDNLDHESAFVRALNSFGIGGRNESARELYGRLSGRGVDADFFPSWGSGASKGKQAIPKLLDNAVEQHKRASALNQAGIEPATITTTAAREVSEAFQLAADKLDPVFGAIANGAFTTGKSLKEWQNKLFRTGEKTQFGEKIYAQFLANTARDNDQLELLAKSMYEKLGELSKGNHAFNSRDFTKIVQQLIEIQATPAELVASFRAFEANPTDSSRVLRSMKRFLDRHASGMRTIEKLLKQGNIGDAATRKRIVDALSEEVFPFLELEARQTDEVTGRYVGLFNNVAENVKTERLVFSPQDQVRMRRVNNAHVIRGDQQQGIGPMFHGTPGDTPITKFDLKFANLEDPDIPVVGFHFDSEFGEAKLWGHYPTGRPTSAKSSVTQAQLNVKKLASREQVFETAKKLGPGATNREVTDDLIKQGFDGVEMAGPAKITPEQRKALDAGEDIKPKPGVILRKDEAGRIEYRSGSDDTGYNRIGYYDSLEEWLSEEVATRSRVVVFDPKNIQVESPATKNALAKFAGRQAGTLEDTELDEALAEVAKLASRKLTDAEAIEAASQIDLITQFSRLNKIEVGETLALLRRRTKGQTRRVERVVEEQPPLWDANRTRWNARQVVSNLLDYGLELNVDEFGFYVVKPREVRPGTLKRSYNFDTKQQFRTFADAMGAVRKMLVENPGYVQKYGPGKVSVRRPIDIAGQEVDALREALKRQGDYDIVTGSRKVFDDDLVPDTLRADWERLNKLKERRQLPPDHRLHEPGPVRGRKETVVTELGTPTSADDLSLTFRTGVGEEAMDLGPGEISEWAKNYGQGRMLLAELMNSVKNARRYNMPLKVDHRILDDLQNNLAATGRIVSDIMGQHLPSEFNELMQLATKFSAYSFEAAKRSGVWVPGAPVGYLPRFFNKEARARIAKLIGEIEVEDSGILTRLGIKQAQYFKRSYDEMGIDDLNDLYAELRDVANSKTASPKLRELNKRLDSEMNRAGIGVTGVLNKLQITGTRVESDPFISLLQRLGVAQQDANLERYFDSLLAASNGKNGESLMLGGRLVGIIDDTGNVHELNRRAYKTRQTKRAKGMRTFEAIEDTATQEYVPKSFMVELPGGEIKVIENAALNETGFGFLDLGAKTPGIDGPRTAGQAFAQASLRSDLHESVTRRMLTDIEAQRMLGSQVVFGDHNNIVSAVKASSAALQVTPTAARMFDTINYGIKSFQTIFRLPFHIANLSSGVFQASLAGATPANLAASYVDTLRLLFGNQDFARHASAVNTLMDIGSDASSLGVVNLLRGDKTLLQQAARMHGGGDFSKWLAKNNPELFENLDAVEHLVIPLGDGRELDLLEFVQTAGEMQLYGTFASSLVRGSRTVSDNLLRIKLNAIDPGVGVASNVLASGKKIIEKAQNIAETSEVINRTATALALVRDGHPMRRAIEIAKEAHVPYEKLTPFEKNTLKRFSVYYTFPRHYMPWAWARFMEDPSKLSTISHFLRDQKLVTTQEGSPSIVLGDQRVNIARLNANLEAAGLVAGFADLFMGAAEVLPGMDNTDARKLRRNYSLAGLNNVGGVASLLFPVQVGFDPQRNYSGGGDIWERASQTVWPFKIMDMVRKGEQSPYVSYTPMEQWFIDNNVFGLGLRKVGKAHEQRLAISAFRRQIKGLQLRAAATENPQRRAEIMEQVQELSYGVRQLIGEGRQKLFP